MTVSEAEKTTYIETAKVLKGSDRRMIMARIVQNLGPGGQRSRRSPPGLGPSYHPQRDARIKQRHSLSGCLWGPGPQTR